MPRHRLQELRYGEDGTGTEPAAHVVARDVVEHGFLGNLEDDVLQLLQRGDAGHFGLGLRVTEDEVAKTHVLFQQVSHVNVHLLRVLVDKEEPLSFGLRLIDNLGALQNERNIFIVTANLA